MWLAIRLLFLHSFSLFHSTRQKSRLTNQWENIQGENDRVPPAVPRPFLPDIFVLNIFAKTFLFRRLSGLHLLLLKKSQKWEGNSVVTFSLHSLVIKAGDLLCTHFLATNFFTLDDDWFLHPVITALLPVAVWCLYLTMSGSLVLQLHCTLCTPAKICLLCNQKVRTSPSFSKVIFSLFLTHISGEKSTHHSIDTERPIIRYIAKYIAYIRFFE